MAQAIKPEPLSPEDQIVYGSTRTHPNILSWKCGKTPQITRCIPWLGKCTVVPFSWSGDRVRTAPEP
jgi:hypothetical protein